MKKILLLIATIAFLSASNFSQGIRSYKQNDYNKAFNYFKKALEEENVNNANYFLGIMYLYGLGTKKDLAKAEKHLKKAEKIGNARAKCYLGEILIIKYNDKNNAKKLLKEGLELGALECKNIAKKYNINL